MDGADVAPEDRAAGVREDQAGRCGEELSSFPRLPEIGQTIRIRRARCSSLRESGPTVQWPTSCSFGITFVGPMAVISSSQVFWVFVFPSLTIHVELCRI